MYSTTLQVSKSGDVYFSVGSTVASKMMPLTDIVAGPRDVFFSRSECVWYLVLALVLFTLAL